MTSLKDVYVATLDPETGKVVEKPKRVTRRFVGRNRLPAWSPDGRHLAYVSVRGEGPRGAGVICIRSLETGEERELNLNPKIAIRRMRWASDGRSIFASGYDRRSVFSIDTDTGEAKRLTKKWEEVAGLSRDGKKTYYPGEGDSGSGILARDETTGKETLLYPAPSLHRDALGRTIQRFLNLSLSPDGQRLAFFERKLGEDDRLVVVPTTAEDGRELLQLSEEKFRRQAGLAWTSDGRYLLFGRGRRGNIELWRISSKGGKPEKLGVASPAIESLTVHPDGRRIAFTGGFRNDRDVWVMENFLPPLARAK